MGREEILRKFEENSDYIRERVQSGIELHRKGRVKIRVVDADKKACKGATVEFCQRNHAFRYGANLFMLDEFECEEKNKRYRELFKDAFNLATLPFYWCDLEPEKGKPRYNKNSEKIYRRPTPDLCLEYCEQYGIEPKVHCLNYDSWSPDWLKYASTHEIKKKLVKRFKELSQRYAEKIPSWEVTNETLHQWDVKQTDFFYEDDNVEWSFRLAEREFPYNKLIINEADPWGFRYPETNRNTYYMQIERLLRQNIRVDSIGMQFHSFLPRENEKELLNSRYDPIFLYNVLDNFARLGLPIQITEMTIPAYSTGAEDQAIQAELIRYLYSIFFSHPAMEAVIYWNLPDGYAAFAPLGDLKTGENYYQGGLLNFDLSCKPSYKVIRDLFSKEWRTNGRTCTNDNGEATFRGFYGVYDLTIYADGRTIKEEIELRADSKNEFIVQI